MSNQIAIESYLADLYPTEYLAYEGSLISMACESDDSAKPGFAERLKARIRQFVEWIKKIIRVIREKIHTVIAKMRKGKNDNVKQPARTVTNKEVEYVLRYSKITTNLKNPSELYRKLIDGCREIDKSQPLMSKIRSNYIDIMTMFTNAMPGNLVESDVGKITGEENDKLHSEIRDICEKAASISYGSTSSKLDFRNFVEDVEIRLENPTDSTEYDSIKDQKGLRDSIIQLRASSGESMTSYDSFVRTMENGLTFAEILVNNSSKYSPEEVRLLNQLLAQATTDVNTCNMVLNVVNTIFDCAYNLSHSFYTVSVYNPK